MGALYLLLAVFTSTIGMGWLALSQTRNWRKVTTAPASEGVILRLRIGGWIWVIGALVFCALRDGGSFAALLWPLLLGLAAINVAMALSYRPTFLRALIPFAVRRREKTEG